MDKTINKLLIVDDHQIVLDGYKNLLESEGFEVVGCAHNSNDGYALYKKLKPNVALIDISMPGKSGLSCVENIMSYDPVAKLIVCTMYDETQIAARAMRCGAKGFVSKDNSSSVMVSAIRQVLKGGFYLSQKHAQIIALMDINKSEETEKDLSFSQLDSLSAKEFSIFKMVAEGLNTKEIASEMFLSVKTVANYRSRILRKIRAKNMRELMLIAIRHGVVKSIVEI